LTLHKESGRLAQYALFCPQSNFLGFFFESWRFGYDRTFLSEEELFLIKVYDNQIEKALKALKRQLAKEGLLKELKRRSFYEKPSVKRKRKQKEARKKRIKAQRYLTAPSR